MPPKLEVHLVAPVEGLADSFDAAAREEAAKKAGGGAPQMQLRIDEDMYERLMSVSYYFKWCEARRNSGAQLWRNSGAILSDASSNTSTGTSSARGTAPTRASAARRRS